MTSVVGHTLANMRLPFVACAFLAFLSPALATHFPCQRGYHNPDHTLWCSANVDGNGVYSCHGSDQGAAKGNHKVADWNKFSPRTLEFGTPCGSGGYAFVSVPLGETCNAGKWLVGNVDNDNVFYTLNARDDCHVAKTYDKAPSSVDIYYDKTT